MSHDTRLIRAQAEANRINQFTPFGSLTFSGGPLNSTATLNLDPETQQLVDQLGGATMSRLGQLPTEAFNPDIPQVGGQAAGALGPFDQSTQAQQAVFQQAQSLLEPQFEQREERLRQTLANQGLPIGSEAFEGEFNRFDRERNRAFNEAAMQSVLAGNQRQDQLFGQGLAALGAQQGIRNQNFGEAEQLFGLRQASIPQLGQFFAPANLDTGPDAQRNMARQQRSSQRESAALGALSTLGAAAIFSDRRLKRFIHRIGEVAGLPLYLFQYIWGGGWQVGHMADEVEKVYPDAVLRHSSGYLMVDYSQVWG